MFDFIVLVSCAGFLWFSWRLLRSAQVDSVVISYERLYVQSLARVEILVARLNQLSLCLPHIDRQELVVQYHRSVAAMEGFVEGLHQLRFQESKDHTVRSMEPMILDLERGVDSCVKGFESELQDRPNLRKTLATLGGRLGNATGCFFCAKPYSPRTFKEVKIKFQGEYQTVEGCSQCRGRLRARREIDVLHFVVGGERRHWSEVAAYDPQRDYWQLRSKKSKHRVSLSLVSAEGEI